VKVKRLAAGLSAKTNMPAAAIGGASRWQAHASAWRRSRLSGRGVAAAPEIKAASFSRRRRRVTLTSEQSCWRGNGSRRHHGGTLCGWRRRRGRRGVPALTTGAKNEAKRRAEEKRRLLWLALQPGNSHAVCCAGARSCASRLLYLCNAAAAKSADVWISGGAAAAALRL